MDESLNLRGKKLHDDDDGDEKYDCNENSAITLSETWSTLTCNCCLCL